MSTIETIQDLLQRTLAGRKIDIVGFVDELLAFASEMGEIRITLASEAAIRITIGDQALDVELEAARAKLRMICARLSTLCNEAAGTSVSPYGGEGLFYRPSKRETEACRFAVRFTNTPGEHEVTITPTRVEKHMATTG